MGAALTYARRYALFTLVGIAGEDDIDTPAVPLIGVPSGLCRTPAATASATVAPAQSTDAVVSIKLAELAIERAKNL